MTTSSRLSCQKRAGDRALSSSTQNPYGGCGHALEAMERLQGSRSIPCTGSVSESPSNDLLHDYCQWSLFSTLIHHRGRLISQSLPIRSAEFFRVSVLLRACPRPSGGVSLLQHFSCRPLGTFRFGRYIDSENGSLKPHGFSRAAPDAEARDHGQKSSSQSSEPQQNPFRMFSEFIGFASSWSEETKIEQHHVWIRQ
jgi:hypothetical protein